MADTIGIILEYLHRHHFSKAEAVLREEVAARQQLNGPLPLPLNDALDLDVTLYLKLMQEKAAGQHHFLNVKNPKPSFDIEKKSSSEMELSAQLLRQEAEDKLHSQVDKLWPSTKVEEPEPLFMEFGVEELEHPAMTLQRVGNSVSLPDMHSAVPEKALMDTMLPVVLSPVSEKTLLDAKNALVRDAYCLQKIDQLMLRNIVSRLHYFYTMIWGHYLPRDWFKFLENGLVGRG